MNPFGNAQGAGIAMPAAPPAGQPSGGPEGTFDMPADPNWQPLEFGDTLDSEGAFCGRITADTYGEVNNKGGVWFTIEIQDADFSGKKLTKHMQAPNVNEKMITWWRKLMLSMTGSKEAAQGQIKWGGAGYYTGQSVFFTTDSFWNDKGDRRTGVDQWITQAEYEEHVAKGRHRWAPKQQTAKSTGLPTGLPGGFPGGLPPGPPQPQAAQPMRPPQPGEVGGPAINRLGSSDSPGPMAPSPLTPTAQAPVQNGVTTGAAPAAPAPAAPPKFTFQGKR